MEVIQLSNKNYKLKELRSDVEQIVSIGQKKEDILGTRNQLLAEKVKTYPYSAEDIKDLLIQAKGRCSYKIIDAIELTTLEYSPKVKEVCDFLLKSKAISPVAVIPINLKPASDNDYGSKWTSLVIERSFAHELHALYQDSFGTPIDKTLKQHLDGCTTIHVRDLQTQQQSNNYDSGPFAVFNLHSLATTRELANITDHTVINQRKLLALQRLEKTEYKPLIEQLAYKKSQQEIKDLVIVLKDLGYLTTKLGELSGELKYYTEAAVFYQYVITILEVDNKLNNESENEFIEEQLTDSYQQLTYIQTLIISSIGGDQRKAQIIHGEAEANKKILIILREKLDEEMQVIEIHHQKANTANEEEKRVYQEFYVNAVRALFKETANEMKKFLAKLYSDSEQQMVVKPPCKYAIVGLGSMALQQMTPYSDLEFAILIENEGNNENEGKEIKQYFKNLSHLVNFKIINLGESVIPTSKYGLDMSHLVHAAVNFDLGGKTPLGRIGGDKPYTLIKTVDWMLDYVYNKQDKVSHIDKTLPYILENVCYVYGDEELVKTYKGKVTKFLNNEIEDNEHGKLKNCEIRAIKLLTKESVEINYGKVDLVLPISPKGDWDIPKGDVGKLQPKLFDTAGRLFNVKREIYRLPDRMVYNLGLYYCIEGDSAWDTVDKLKEQGIITLRAALNLKNAVTFATTIRLKTYLHHKAQNDDMSIFVRPADTEFDGTEQAKQIFHLSKEDLGEQGGLFQYFYTALPLHERLQNFCDQHKTLDDTRRKSFYQDTDFYQDDSANKGLIYYRLAQYKEAQSNLEKAVNEPKNTDKCQVRNVLGCTYINFGDGEKAREQFDHCLRIPNRILYLDLDVANLHLNLGAAYNAKGEFGNAIDHYEKSQYILEQIYNGEPHLEISHSLNNLGNVYIIQGNYKKAIDYHSRSLEIRKQIHKEEPHPHIAYSLHNLGIVYKAQGNYKKAIDHYEKGLKMLERIYKEEPHLDIADTLNNLGIIYYAKGELDQAIDHFVKGLEMLGCIYKDKSHRKMACYLINVGAAYDAKEQYDQAIEHYETSLDMLERIYKGLPNLGMAAALTNLGAAYNAKEQYDQAIDYYERSLDMLEQIYRNLPNIDIAHILNNLGAAYKAKKKFDQAIDHYQKSLKMKRLIYNEPHRDIANALNNLALAYCAEGEFDQAIRHNNEAFQITFILRFQDSSSIDNIKTSFKTIVSAFSDKYNLNPKKIFLKALEYIETDTDFTSYELHYKQAQLLQKDCKKKEEMLEEYKLSLIFLPKEKSELKLEICNELAKLTGENHENIEL